MNENVILNFIGGGGGGTSMNFDVIPNPQPASAKENTIWIDTEVITGWIFSATQPEAAAEGAVWIQTGINSPAEFNALKKNGITVYPVSAKQYIGGEWVPKTAQSYQAGAWVDWINLVQLYDNGVQYVEFEKVTNGSSSNATEADGRLILKTSGVGYGYWVTQTKLDSSIVHKLCAEITRNAGAASALWIGLVTEKDATTPAVIIDLSAAVAKEGLCYTELGSIPSGEYYVKAYVKVVAGNSAQLHISKLYFE